MSNYTKTTNFLAKDSLPENDTGKIIKGSEFDTEFNALQTAVNTKADSASPTLTGVPTAPTATAGTNTTQLATTAFVAAASDATRTYNTLQTFKDTTFEVVDDADTTKKLNLQLSGITTATTRTLTVPNKNGTIATTDDLTQGTPLNAANNTVVSGSYAVTSSATITITATNTFSVGQSVFIQFTNTSGSALTAGNFTIVTATGSSFTINFGSSVTSAGTCITTRYGIIALATPTDLFNRTDTLRAVTSSNLTITRATEQATTSGTAKSFTGIPSWVRKITVIYNAVATTGSSDTQVQLGSTSFTTTGYDSYYGYFGQGGNASEYLGTGFGVWNGSAGDRIYINMVIANVSGNTWVCSYGGGLRGGGGGGYGVAGGGTVTLSGVLDRVQVTTRSTDTFNNGSVNIMYE